MLRIFLKLGFLTAATLLALALVLGIHMSLQLIANLPERKETRATRRVATGSVKTSSPILPQQPSQLRHGSFPNRSFVILVLLIGGAPFNSLATLRPAQPRRRNLRLTC